MNPEIETEVEPRRRPSRQPALPRKTFSIAETTHVTGLGATTVNALIASGTLRSTKVGRRRLIFADSIDALLSHAAE
jgi:excisionase family DNA binding protein